MADTENKLSASVELLAKTAEQLENVSTELHAKMAAVSSTTSQLETTVNSYKDALLKVPASSHPSWNNESQYNLDPAIGKSADRKSRQVLIEFINDQFISLSEKAIKEKILDTFKQISTPAPPKDIVIEEILKLRNRAIIICFGTKEVMEWLQETKAELLFTAKLHPGANIKLQQYTILAPKLPITLDVNNDEHIREIEEVN